MKNLIAVLMVVTLTGGALAARADESECGRKFREANTEYFKLLLQAKTKSAEDAAGQVQGHIDAAALITYGTVGVTAVCLIVTRSRGAAGCLFLVPVTVVAAASMVFKGSAMDHVRDLISAHVIYQAGFESVTGTVGDSDQTKAFYAEAGAGDDDQRTKIAAMVQAQIDSGELCNTNDGKLAQVDQVAAKIMAINKGVAK